MATGVSSADASAARFVVLDQGICVPVTINLINDLKLRRLCNVGAPLRLLFEWTIARIQKLSTEGDMRQGSDLGRKTQSTLFNFDSLNEFDFFGFAVPQNDGNLSHVTPTEWHFLELDRALTKQDRAVLPANWSTLLATSKKAAGSARSANINSRNGGLPDAAADESIRLHLRVKFYPNALLFDNVFRTSVAIDMLYLQLRRDVVDMPIVTEFDSEVTSTRRADSRHDDTTNGDAALYDAYESLSQRETVRRLVLLAAYAILIEHRRCCASRIVQTVYRGLSSASAGHEEVMERGGRSRSRDSSKSRRLAPFRKYFHSLLTDGHIRLDEYMSIEAIKLTRHIDALISLMHSAVERVLSRIQTATAASAPDNVQMGRIDESMAARLKMTYCCESQRLAAFGMHLFRTRESFLGVSLSGLAVLTRNYLLAADFSSHANHRFDQSNTNTPIVAAGAIEFDVERHLLLQNRFRWNEIAAVRFRHDRFTVQLRSRRTRPLGEADAAQHFDPDWPAALSQSLENASSRGHKTKLRLDSSKKCSLLLRFCNEQLHFYRLVIEQIKRMQEHEAKASRGKLAAANVNGNTAVQPTARTLVPQTQTQVQMTAATVANGQGPMNAQNLPPQPSGGVPYNVQVDEIDGSVTFEVALLIQNASAYLLFRDSLNNSGNNGKLSVNIARLSDVELNRLFARTLGFTVAKTPDTLRAALRRSDPRNATTCQVDHVVETPGMAAQNASSIRRGDLLLRINNVSVRYFALRYVLNVIVDECVAETLRNREEPSVIRLKLKRMRVNPNSTNFTNGVDRRVREDTMNVPAQPQIATNYRYTNTNTNTNTNNDPQYSYSRPRVPQAAYNEPVNFRVSNGYLHQSGNAPVRLNGGFRSANAIDGIGQPLSNGDVHFALQQPPSGRQAHHRSGRVPLSDDRYKMSRSQPQLSNAERQLGAPFNTPQTRTHGHAQLQLNPNARALANTGNIGQSRLDSNPVQMPQAQYTYARPTGASRPHSGMPHPYYAYDRPQQHQFADSEFQVARFDMIDHDSDIL